MRLYDSLTRELQEVTPITPGRVTMYACGPTVYRYAHLGNLRSFMLYDLIRRALQYEGFEVEEVMNITDVGHMTDESSTEAVDKMQLAMEDEGLVAERHDRVLAHPHSACVRVRVSWISSSPRHNSSSPAPRATSRSG